MIYSKFIFILSLVIFMTPSLTSAQSQTLDVPTMSSTDNDTMDFQTHPILRLSQDKSEMITLDQPAASVVVGNPNHVSVLLDTPDTLIVVPRAPGASHFSVIGEDGAILMQRHVIVGGAKEQYVRIRRSCRPTDRDCQPTSVYFCPDTCHEVQENTQR